ncbi:MAG: trypsin-like peptidase domain-containing protein [Candidatus Latescibacterota bacterium]|nr:trypsin-like peptidase domain-containing protein [Candidatus Latescibacterota bacterium]
MIPASCTLLVRRRSVFVVGVILLAAVAAPSHEKGDLSAPQELSHAFRNVHESVAPAVVLVRTSGDLSHRLPRFHPPIGPQDEAPFSGLGSGVIVDSAGYVLSNHHVVREADTIYVTLNDRRRFHAEVVGVDSLIDIALLKIDGEDLPVAPLGNSRDLLIGDWVVAIGYPLGMGATLTHGIVSALGRQADVIPGEYGIESFIQTNAVINPGNSGGPLLDLDGRVVGINAAISTKTGYFIGYGLAVPVDLAREAMRDFLEHGRTVRGYLGIRMQSVDDLLVRERGLELDPPAGVYISGTLDDSPAGRSELQVGDVILSVNGDPVNSSNQVQTQIYQLDPGDSVALEIWRNGATATAMVVLGERETDHRLAQARRRVTRLGLTVEVLDSVRADTLGFTPGVARELGLKVVDQAVVVVAIDPDGDAAAKGIRVNDVITEIDQTVVSSLDQFMKSISQLRDGEAALFWLWREDGGIDVRTLRIQPAE